MNRDEELRDELGPFTLRLERRLSRIEGSVADALDLLERHEEDLRQLRLAEAVRAECELAASRRKDRKR